MWKGFEPYHRKCNQLEYMKASIFCAEEGDYVYLISYRSYLYYLLSISLFFSLFSIPLQMDSKEVSIFSKSLILLSRFQESSQLKEH